MQCREYYRARHDGIDFTSQFEAGWKCYSKVDMEDERDTESESTASTSSTTDERLLFALRWFSLVWCRAWSMGHESANNAYKSQTFGVSKLLSHQYWFCLLRLSGNYVPKEASSIAFAAPKIIRWSPLIQDYSFRLGQLRATPRWEAQWFARRQNTESLYNEWGLVNANGLEFKLKFMLITNLIWNSDTKS